MGIYSANGSEFFNDLLFNYCQNQLITFTRSRPDHKNDLTHVEQKNWSVVRHLVGFDRLEIEAECLILNAIYADLRLYDNFFQPVLKLVGKKRLGEKGIKRYDIATTPYQRVLGSPYVKEKLKLFLHLHYDQLNLVSFRNRIGANFAKLWKLFR